MKRVHHKRHHDDEIIDEITFKVVPRYKTSGLSGNEWRLSTLVQLKWKGALLYERSYHRMEDAAAHLPWLLRTFSELSADELSPGGRALLRRRDGLCHQPGCSNTAISVYRLKKEFSREGYYERVPTGDVLMAFCAVHARRGDCGLEDADRNYEVVSGPGPDGAKGWEKHESPSTFGGVVTLDPDE